MSKVQKRTFSITETQSSYIDTAVASGGYASSSEVVREGIRIMQERDRQLEKWLKEEVAPAYDHWMANPDDVLTGDQVFGQLEAELDAMDEARPSAKKSA